MGSWTGGFQILQRAGKIHFQFVTFDMQRTACSYIPGPQTIVIRQCYEMSSFHKHLSVWGTHLAQGKHTHGRGVGGGDKGCDAREGVTKAVMLAVVEITLYAERPPWGCLGKR